MGKRLTIKPYLSVDVLAQRYRQATDPVERSHWQIIWLLAQGCTSTNVAESTPSTVRWIRTLARRYNAQGEGGLRNRRQTNPGRPPVLNSNQQQEFAQAVEGPAPDGGLWTGPKVATWIAARVGRPVPKQRGWEYLRHLQLRRLVPRPRHVQADADQQEAFKKTALAGGRDPSGSVSPPGGSVGDG